MNIIEEKEERKEEGKEEKEEDKEQKVNIMKIKLKVLKTDKIKKNHSSVEKNDLRKSEIIVILNC